MTTTLTPAQQKRKASSVEALELWRQYKATGDLHVRNRLVMTYAPLVKYIVFKKVRELPARCEVEDFISCGLEALIASIDRYDPEKGATLEQFAWTRIHGAVLDELRRQDWAPRSLRRWERDIARARDQFSGVHGRRPVPRGARRHARHHGGRAAPPPGRHRRLRRDLAQHAGHLRRGDHRRAPRHHRRLRRAARPRARRDDQPRQGPVPPRLRPPPAREREVAVLLYVKNLTLREIGEILGVSESRVCQIHSQLKKTLKRQLADDAGLFSAVA
jgi:RNA polymerase sigma factor for flagellar operon FliA